MSVSHEVWFGASVAPKQSSANVVAVAVVQEVVGGSVIVTGAKPAARVGVHVGGIPPSPPLDPAPVPLELVDAPLDALVLVPTPELDIVVPVQNPAIFAVSRFVVQAVPPALTTMSHDETELAGSCVQHVASVAQSGLTVGPPLSMPGPVAGELELLQAAAVMDAAKRTGIASRYRFMAGHHTRTPDQVKTIGAVLRTKTYPRRHIAPLRPAARERYRRALRMTRRV
jgi:hypothetical protein